MWCGRMSSGTDDRWVVLAAWGFGARFIALTFFISFASISSQVLALVGKRGVTPVRDVLARAKEDFPSLRDRLCLFPTVLWWTGSSDFSLLGVVGLGMLSSAALFVGCAGSTFGSMALMLTSQVCLLSLDVGLDLSYPWDCLLYEAGWLALFLPHSLPLWEGTIGLSDHVEPFLSGLFRWLMFRVMIGFGKIKFQGHSPRDNGYIQGFLIFQPIPSVFGWLGNKLPLMFHKVALLGMFVIEMVAPFMLFFPGPPRAIAGVLFISLMIGIQLCGNFGHFNVLTIGLSVPFIFDQSSMFETTMGNPRNAALYLYALCVVFPCSLCHLPFNSWVCQSWPWWPSMDPRVFKNDFLKHTVAYVRMCSPFRFCHAYGVFESRPSPTVRYVPVVQGSIDGGKTWREYEYKFAAMKETSPPVFVAPHHPRLDHQLLYEAFGYDVVSCATLLHSTSSRLPYRFTRNTAMERLCFRLMEKNSACVSLFRFNPFQREGVSPNRTRIVLYALEPCSMDERSAGAVEGGVPRYWHRRYVHAHSSIKRPEESPFQYSIVSGKGWLENGALFFHPDSCILRDATVAGTTLQTKIDSCDWSDRDGAKHLDTLLKDLCGVSDVSPLWKWIQCLQKMPANNLSVRTVEATKLLSLADSFDCVRTLFWGLTWIVLKRTQHLWFDSRPGLGVRAYCPSYFEFILVLHGIFLEAEGMNGLYQCMQNFEEVVQQFAESHSTWQYKSLLAFAVFHEHHLVLASKKHRLSAEISRTRLKTEPSMSDPKVDGSGTLPGWASIVPLLKDDFEMHWETTGENLPTISQDPVDGLTWTVTWDDKKHKAKTQ